MKTFDAGSHLLKRVSSVRAERSVKNSPLSNTGPFWQNLDDKRLVDVLTSSQTEEALQR